MSDLQCPARFLLVCEPDAALAQSLGHERVAAMYAGPSALDDQRRNDDPSRRDGLPGTGAAALASALGLPLQELARSIGLVDVLDEEPVAVSDLTDLADLHRGETVVVVATGSSGARAEVLLDGDGLRVGEVSPEVVR